MIRCYIVDFFMCYRGEIEEIESLSRWNGNSRIREPSILIAPCPLLHYQAADHVSLDIDGRAKSIQEPIDRHQDGYRLGREAN